jgi:hypothetical protein
MVFWFLFVALGVFVAVESSWWASKVLGVVFVAFAVFAFVQGWRSAIRCDSNGVTAIEDIRTRRVPWSDVDQFEERGLRGIGVRLGSGRWVRLMGYATLGQKSPEMATRELERQRILHQPLPIGTSHARPSASLRDR